MKIQNNQQGVITDASQNNQQGVITGQNEINKFLSVQEPVGESVVRFKENFAVPVSPSNPYYPLFFHPELSEFKENIANEVSRLEKLNNLQSSKPALIEMELDPNDRKDLEEAKTSRENSITDANDDYNTAAAEITKDRPNVFETLKIFLSTKTNQIREPIEIGIVNLYKKETEAFKRHLNIEDSDYTEGLLTAKAGTYYSGEVSLKFKDPKIKEFLTLKLYRSLWSEKIDSSWIKQESGIFGSIRALTYGNGMWVAVGYSGLVLTSRNGTSWTKQIIKSNSKRWNQYTSANTTHLMDVAYNNGLWVVVGSFGTILTSSDAISWKQQPTQGNISFQEIAYGNGMWVMWLVVMVDYCYK